MNELDQFSFMDEPSQAVASPAQLGANALDQFAFMDEEADYTIGEYLQQAGSSFVGGLSGTFTSAIEGLGIAVEGMTGESSIDDWARETQESINNAVPGVMGLQNSWTAKVSGAFGSAGGFVLASAATGGLGGAVGKGLSGVSMFGRAALTGAEAVAAGAKVAQATQLVTAGSLGALGNAAARYDEALMLGKSEEDAWKSYFVGMGIGSLEAMPIGLNRAAMRLGRVNKASGGALRNLTVGQVMLAEGLEEAGQEMLSEGLNQLSDYALSIKSAEEAFDFQQLLESGVLGFLPGSAIGGLTARSTIAANLAEERKKVEAEEEAKLTADIAKQREEFEAQKIGAVEQSAKQAQELVAAGEAELARLEGRMPTEEVAPTEAEAAAPAITPVTTPTPTPTTTPAAAPAATVPAAPAAKRLTGSEAQYEAARLAKEQGIDLSKLSREEYAQFAIDNNLELTDTQLRMRTSLRNFEQTDYLREYKKNKPTTPEQDASDLKYANWTHNLGQESEAKYQGKAVPDIAPNVEIAAEKSSGNTWRHFTINKTLIGSGTNATQTKAYLGFSDLFASLTPERVTQFMAELAKAGYKGNVKTIADLTTYRNISDQIVMHGATEADTQLAAKLAQSYFGSELNFQEFGTDITSATEVDKKGKPVTYSYSAWLQKKIKDALDAKATTAPTAPAAPTAPTTPITPIGTEEEINAVRTQLEQLRKNRDVLVEQLRAVTAAPTQQEKLLQAGAYGQAQARAEQAGMGEQFRAATTPGAERVLAAEEQAAWDEKKATWAKAPLFKEKYNGAKNAKLVVAATTEQQNAEKILTDLGVKVEFVDFGNDDLTLEGIESGDTIFLNARLSNDAMLRKVARHEAFHSIFGGKEGRNLWLQTMKQLSVAAPNVWAAAREKAFKELASTKGTVEALNKALKTPEGAEALLNEQGSSAADIFSSTIDALEANPALAEEVMQADPTFFQKLLDWVKTKLNRLGFKYETLADADRKAIEKLPKLLYATQDGEVEVEAGANERIAGAQVLMRLLKAAEEGTVAAASGRERQARVFATRTLGELEADSVIDAKRRELLEKEEAEVRAKYEERRKRVVEAARKRLARVKPSDEEWQVIDAVGAADTEEAQLAAIQSLPGLPSSITDEELRSYVQVANEVYDRNQEKEARQAEAAEKRRQSEERKATAAEQLRVAQEAAYKNKLTDLRAADPKGNALGQIRRLINAGSTEEAARSIAREYAGKKATADQVDETTVALLTAAENLQRKEKEAAEAKAAAAQKRKDDAAQRKATEEADRTRRQEARAREQRERLERRIEADKARRAEIAAKQDEMMAQAYALTQDKLEQQRLELAEKTRVQEAALQVQREKVETLKRQIAQREELAAKATEEADKRAKEQAVVRAQREKVAADNQQAMLQARVRAAEAAEARHRESMAMRQTELTEYTRLREADIAARKALLEQRTAARAAAEQRLAEAKTEAERKQAAKEAEAAKAAQEATERDAQLAAEEAKKAEEREERKRQKLPKVVAGRTVPGQLRVGDIVMFRNRAAKVVEATGSGLDQRVKLRPITDAENQVAMEAEEAGTKDWWNTVPFLGEAVTVDMNDPRITTRIAKRSDVEVLTEDGKKMFERRLEADIELREGDEPRFSVRGRELTPEEREQLVSTAVAFAGGGTFEIALADYINPKIAVEANDGIATAYNTNAYTPARVAKLGDVSPEDFIGQTFFHASPPCVTSSKLRDGQVVSREEETARGREVAEIIRVAKNPIVVIENVSEYRKTEAFKLIAEALDEVGYTWDAQVYKAQDFGSPSRRQRMFVRAVREGALPPAPIPTHASKPSLYEEPFVSWGDTIADLLPTLPEFEGPLPPYVLKSLAAQGINPKSPSKAYYISGTQLYGAAPLAAFDQPSPTIVASEAETPRILMPDGRVLRVTPEAMKRLMGFGSEFVLPEDQKLAKRIVGNGIPKQLTRAVVVPVLESQGYQSREDMFSVKGQSLDTPDTVLYRSEQQEVRSPGTGAIFYTPDRSYAELYMSEDRVLRTASMPRNIIDIRDPSDRRRIKSWIKTELDRLSSAKTGDVRKIAEFVYDARRALAKEDSAQNVSVAMANVALAIGRESNLYPVGLAEKRFLDSVNAPAMTQLEFGRGVGTEVSVAFRSVQDIPSISPRMFEQDARDEDGRVIPLSERFNEATDDIRFSAKGKGKPAKPKPATRVSATEVKRAAAELKKAQARAERSRLKTLRESMTRVEGLAAIAEKGGEGTDIGEAPGTAIAGATEEGRAYTRALREDMADIRDQILPDLKADDEARAEAVAKLDADYEGTKRQLYDEITETGNVSEPWKVYATMVIAAREAEAATTGRMTVDKYLAAYEAEAYDAIVKRAASAGLRVRKDSVMSARKRNKAHLFAETSSLRREMRKLRKAIDTGNKKQRDAAEKKIAKMRQQHAEAVVEFLDSMQQQGYDIDDMYSYLAKGDVVSFSRLARGAADARVRTDLASGRVQSAWDGLMEIRLASMLSGMGTHVANITGNAAMQTLRTTRQLAEVLTNMVYRDPNSADYGDFKAYMTGWLRSLSRATRNFVMAYRTDMPVFEVELSAEAASEFANQTNAIPGIIGRILRFPSLTTLRAFDEFFKTMAAYTETASLAYRDGRSKGISGPALESYIDGVLVNYNDPLWQVGLDRALETVFQGKGDKLTRILLSTREYLNNNPTTVPIGTYLLPFIKTPLQIFKVGLSMPIHPVLPLMRWINTLRGIEYTKAQQVTDSANALIAAGMMMLAYGLLGDDDDDEVAATGAAPDEYTERELMARVAPAYSIKGPGGDWYSYARIEPFATAFSAMVDLSRAQQRLMRDDVPDKWSQSFGIVLNNALGQIEDKTFLRTVGDVAKMVRDREQINVARFAKDLFVTPMIPNLVRQQVGASDPYVRNTSVREYEDVSAWEAAMQVVSFQVYPDANRPDAPPIKYDLWGRSIEKPGRSEFARNFSPAKLEYQEEDIHKLDRLIVTFNDKVEDGKFGGDVQKYLPRAVEYRIKRNDKEYLLTKEEYARVSKEAGEKAAQRLQYRRLNYDDPTERDIEVIKEQISKSRKLIIDRVLRERRLTQNQTPQNP